MLQTLLLPAAKCYMYEWDRDSFGKEFHFLCTESCFDSGCCTMYYMHYAAVLSELPCQHCAGYVGRP